MKKLLQVKHIFLDKTGTLTKNDVAINEKTFFSLTKMDRDKILSLESQIDHPIARGFLKLQQDDGEKFEIEKFEYRPGQGISGQIQGEAWEIISSPKSVKNEKWIDVYKEGKLLTSIQQYTDLKVGLSSM